MILAGVLLKLGAYGFLRLLLPLYPEQARDFAIPLAALATAAIVFGALGAVQSFNYWGYDGRNVTDSEAEGIDLYAISRYYK